MLSGQIRGFVQCLRDGSLKRQHPASSHLTHEGVRTQTVPDKGHGPFVPCSVDGWQPHIVDGAEFFHRSQETRSLRPVPSRGGDTRQTLKTHRDVPLVANRLAQDQALLQNLACLAGISPLQQCQAERSHHAHHAVVALQEAIQVETLGTLLHGTVEITTMEGTGLLVADRGGDAILVIDLPQQAQSFFMEILGAIRFTMMESNAAQTI